MDKNKRWWDWPSGILLLFLVLLVGWRLRATDWAPHLGMMDVLGLFGVVLGLLLGVSKFSPRKVRWFGIGYSIFFIFWQLGIAVGNEVQWPMRLAVIIGQLWADLYLFSLNLAVTDPLLFLASIGLLIWLLAIFAGYRLARYGRPWWPLFVIALSMVIIDYYNPFFKTRDRFTGIFFLLFVLLIARQFFIHAREKWEQDNVIVDSEAGFDLGKGAVAVGLAIILVAWNVPLLIQVMTAGTPMQQRFERSWLKLRDRLSNAVAGLTSPVVYVSDSYGDSISLGRGAATGNDVVFTVQLPDTQRPAGTRFYWKARSYDLYTGTGWQTSVIEQIVSPANDWRVVTAPYKDRVSMSFTMTVQNSAIQSIYSPGVPLNFNHTVVSLVAPADNGEVDLIGTIAQPILRKGEDYTVQALIQNPSVTAVRNSSNQYPDWVKNRYLQLPSNFSAKITELAMHITSVETNPYDKAVDITRYLRQTITYTEKMDAPPPGADVMEWFLFDYKKGFCNYYATAEVLMLRSIGIPARLSVGYAEGELNSDTNILTERSKDSHAWPEVYFNGIGWIEFEPTVSQPEHLLPEDRSANNNEPITPDRPSNLKPNQRTGEDRANQLDQQGAGGQNSFAKQGWLVLVAVAFILGGISLGIFTWFRYSPRASIEPLPIQVKKYLRRRGKQVPNWLETLTNRVELTPMEHLFVWINRLLRWIGKPPTAGMTPRERMDLLVETIPGLEEPANTLLKEYLLAEYSQYPADLRKARLAGWNLWRLAIKYRITHLFTVSYE